MDAPYRSPVSTKTRRSTFAITLMRSSGQSPGWIHRGGPSHGNSRFASADCARRQGSDLRCDRRRVTRYALAFLEGDHSFTRLESRTGSFTSGTSMERVSTRWPEDRGYIESVRHRECAGTVRGNSRKRLSIALRSYDRDCLPERSGREAAQERRRSTSCAGCDPPGIRGSGGIGRRAGLRIQWGNPSGFESRLSHGVSHGCAEFRVRSLRG